MKVDTVDRIKVKRTKVKVKIIGRFKSLENQKLILQRIPIITEVSNYLSLVDQPFQGELHFNKLNVCFYVWIYQGTKDNKNFQEVLRI